MNVSGERKVLRKSRLGVPDVYPQDSRQKEDDLCGVHLKQGFSVSSVPLLTDEYGSGSGKALSSGGEKSLSMDLKLIYRRKRELSGAFSSGYPPVGSPGIPLGGGGSAGAGTLKRQPLNTKDNFTLVTAKTARKADLWFKDLSSGSKSLHLLSKKVPILNKREDILGSLLGIPVRRASWLIKMTAAYHTSMSETNKSKKRASLPDPGVEWTAAITKFMKEQLHEINSSSSSSAPTDIPANDGPPHKAWNYALELSEYMYSEGLLDRQDFLSWILEIMEKTRYPDEPSFRFILPLALQYLKEWTQSEILSRKLAYTSAKKISLLLNETEALNSKEGSENRSPLSASFLELLNDPSTRFILLSLSTILQVVVMDCPSALVWGFQCENKGPSCLLGSPLDLLPGVLPSMLPLSPGPNNASTRQVLRQAESLIKERSAAVEARWSNAGDRGSSHSRTSNNVSTILSILEDLDSYCFDKMDSGSNTQESLYGRLFRSNPGEPLGGNPSDDHHHSSKGSSSSEPRDQEESIIIHTLCTWTVSSKRSGEHRAFLAAKILERRQSELLYKDSEDMEEDSEVEGAAEVGGDNYVFQGQLFNYLDNDAPTMSGNKQEFSNLILLFYELIAHDVFSHDQYLCTLISRGDLNNPMDAALKSSKEDGEDRKINDDITNIVNEIKVGNQLSDSSSPRDLDASLYSRHWQYTYHFPLPMEESYNHDSNQRFVLLYGAGKAKEEPARSCKKLSKELLKLFSKKHCIDVSDGGKVRKGPGGKGEFNFDGVRSRFQGLSYYDQHSISHQCGQSVVEMLSVFTQLNGNYVPVPEHVLFLFDLAGLSLNIQGLLDWCLLILKELPGVEAQLVERSSSLVRSYTSTLALYVVGVLRCYHSIFILSAAEVNSAFDVLCKIIFRSNSSSMKNSSSSIEYNSAEWCILAYLYDLSCNYSLFKNRERFQDLKRLFSQSTDPSESSYSHTDRRFGMEFISNPKKKLEVPLKSMENPKNQYNFVVNVFIEVCECNDTEKLNDLAILCCEFTAAYNSLGSEWLGALTALCNAGASNAYADLLLAVNIRDSALYNRLGIFISILIARHCFQLQSFVISVAIPSLLKAWDDVKDNSPSRQESEIGARVSCHLLLRLFKSIEPFTPMFYTLGSPRPMPIPSTHASGIRCSSDRHLLAAAHRNITVGAIIAVLKAIMVLGDANNSSASHDNDFGLGSIGLATRTETATLSDFAKYTLRLICQQQWVYDRCLQVPDDLLRNGTLLDPMLSSKQAQTLLRLICSGSNNSLALGESNEVSRRSISSILNNLDEWNLRVSIVDIKLTYHQLSQVGSGELSDWLDAVASAIVDSFQTRENTSSPLKKEDPSGGGSEAKKLKLSERKSLLKYSSVWMIPSLVKHLKFLQSRVLKVAIEFLEVGRGKPPNPGRPQRGLNPFLGLILTCIRELDSEGKDKKDRIDREELKDNLLSSLHGQLTGYMNYYYRGRNWTFENEESRKRIQDALLLRFSLLGGLFDTVLSSSNYVNEWSCLLTQLIARGVVDLTSNAEAFTTVLDMLTVLIHSTLLSESADKGSEDSRKGYQSLVKKLRREIGERDSRSVSFLKQLLPLPKVLLEALIAEPFGFVADNKGNKVKGLNSDKKQGLQLFDRSKISPWEFLEGHKNPAPLSWTWFAALKHERKPLKYLEAFNELKYANSSSLDKPNSYFLVAPPLPIENLEPVNKEVKGPDGRDKALAPPNQMQAQSHQHHHQMMMQPHPSNIPMHHHPPGQPHAMHHPSVGGGHPMSSSASASPFPSPNMKPHPMHQSMGGHPIMNNPPMPNTSSSNNNPMMFSSGYNQPSFGNNNSNYNSNSNSGGMGMPMRYPMAATSAGSAPPRQMMNPPGGTGHQMMMNPPNRSMRPRHMMGNATNNRIMPSGGNMNYSQQQQQGPGGNTASWPGGGNYGQQQQQQTQQHMYNSGTGGPVGFVGPSGGGGRYQGKQALQNMLRAKHPTPFIGAGGGGGQPQQQQYGSAPNYRPQTQPSNSTPPNANPVVPGGGGNAPGMYPSPNMGPNNFNNGFMGGNNPSGGNSGGQYMMRPTGGGGNYSQQQGMMRRGPGGAAYPRNHGPYPPQGNAPGNNYRGGGPTGAGNMNAQQQLMGHVPQGGGPQPGQQQQGHPQSQIGFQQQSMF